VFARLCLVACLVLLTACGPSGKPDAAPPAKAAAPKPLPPAPPALVERLNALAGEFGGDVGIAVRDVQSGWLAGVDADSIYPQQSVRKFWVALALLDGVDHGRVRLDEPVVIRREDLSVFHQPLRGKVGQNGFATTYDWLLVEALTKSDNAANDALIRRNGGPEAVAGVLAAKGIEGVRIGPLEPALQSAAAGLAWRPEYAFDWNFQHAREALPDVVRRTSLQAYLDDPTDGATPAAITAGLARLKRGELLSPASTARLLEIMAASETGKKRLRAGLGEGWTLSHKTGTGQELGAMTTGYNDVGLLTAPDGRAYAVAVMIRKTTKRLELRQQLIADVARAVVAQHDGTLGAEAAPAT
jgi:beta-lactamase class A